MKRLQAATADRERCNLSSLTCRTLLLLLFGTGLRIGEAVGLNLADVARNEKELPLMRAVETKASIRAE